MLSASSDSTASAEATLTEVLGDSDGEGRRKLLEMMTELLVEAGRRTEPTDDLEALIEQWRLDQTRRGLSAFYVHNSINVVRPFAKWLEPRSVIGAVRSDIEEWLDTLHVGLGCRRNYLAHLHSFFVFLNEHSGTPVPTEKIRRPKAPRLVPHPIQDDDLRHALQRARTPDLRLWLLLGAYEGLRCLEIAALRAEDIDFARMVLRVDRGKGAKGRVVPLHPDVAKALRQLPMPPRGPLFYTLQRRRPVNRTIVSQRINTYLRSLGIPSTAHGLRHWFGTRLYQATKDIRLVQELLGHSTPAVTAIYAAWDTSTAGPAVARLSISHPVDPFDAAV